MADLIDHRVEPAHVGGFGEISLGAALQASVNIFLVVGSAPHYFGDAMVPLVILQSPEHFFTGDAGHFIIYDDHLRESIRRTIAEIGQGFVTAGHAFHIGAGIAKQEAVSEHFTVVRIVIRQEDIGSF